MGSLHKIKGSPWWRYQWRDHIGRIRTRTFKGVTDLKTVKQIVAKIDAKLSDIAHGLVDPAELQYQRDGKAPIGKHIDGWEAMLAAGNPAGYAKEESNLVRRIAAAGKFVCLLDITGSEAKTTIGRLPRARGKGTLSNRQKNKALTACKMFCEQMRRDKKMKVNPLLDVSGWNEGIDQRKQHAGFEETEIELIVQAARNSSHVVGGMTGEQRAVLYQTAAGTGFRRRTLMSLTPRHLKFNKFQSQIAVSASNVKNKKAKYQPIRSELADALRAFTAGMGHDGLIFRPEKRADFAGMLRVDLKDAGLDYESEPGKFRTFHSFRSAFITGAGRTGGLKVAQELAGHSTPALTAKYMRLKMTDLAEGLKGVPTVKPSAKKKGAKSA